MAAQTVSRNVVCPTCEHVNRFQATTVIHDGSEEHTALYKGMLNRVTCEKCKGNFLFEHPVLYRDDAARYVVYYLPRTHFDKVENAIDVMKRLVDGIFAETPEPIRPDCRLAITRNQFIEKVALHQHGYDDRLVELVKYQLYQHSPGLDPVRFELLFNFTSATEDEDTVPFLAFDRESGKMAYALQFHLEDYEDLERYYLEDADHTKMLDDMYRGFYVQVETLLANLGLPKPADEEA